MTTDKQIEQEARAIFQKLIKRVPRNQLWPVITGLLGHLLLTNAASPSNYSYGIYAIADTLHDAAYFQCQKGLNVQLDIYELTNLRRRHLSRSIM